MKKKTIGGIALSIAALGGLSAPEAIEYSKEYSRDQIIEFTQNKGKDWKQKKADVLSRVFVPKENILTGKRKAQYGGYEIAFLEKTVEGDNLKIVVEAKKGDVTKRFKPFRYVNPPISNKTCTGEPDIDLICEYDFDTEDVLKKIVVQTLDLVWDKKGEESVLSK